MMSRLVVPGETSGSVWVITILSELRNGRPFLNQLNVSSSDGMASTWQEIFTSRPIWMLSSLWYGSGVIQNRPFFRAETEINALRQSTALSWQSTLLPWNDQGPGPGSHSQTQFLHEFYYTCCCHPRAIYFSLFITCCLLTLHSPRPFPTFTPYPWLCFGPPPPLTSLDHPKASNWPLSFKSHPRVDVFQDAWSRHQTSLCFFSLPPLVPFDKS